MFWVMIASLELSSVFQKDSLEEVTTATILELLL